MDIILWNKLIKTKKNTRKEKDTPFKLVQNNRKIDPTNLAVKLYGLLQESVRRRQKEEKVRIIEIVTASIDKHFGSSIRIETLILISKS